MVAALGSVEPAQRSIVWAAQSRRRSIKTTADQALIRGLVTAFRVCVLGLFRCLEGGRRTGGMCQGAT